MTNDIHVYRRDTPGITVNVVDSTGTVVNITGYTFILTVKEYDTDVDASAKFQKVVTSHIDPTHGQTLIQLTTTDTNQTAKRYFYDIEMIDNALTPSITTLVKGDFYIDQDITVRN